MNSTENSKVKKTFKSIGAPTLIKPTEKPPKIRTLFQLLITHPSHVYELVISCGTFHIGEGWGSYKRERKTSVSGGDCRELSVCSIHPQSDAHRTKVWKYRSTPPF
jgi:hypothetical protein